MRSSVLGLLGFLFFVSPSLAAAQPDSTLLRAVMVGDGVARVETAWTTSARGRRARVTARVGEGPELVVHEGVTVRAAVAGDADHLCIVLYHGGDTDPFYQTKLTLGRYYIERILPETSGRLAKLKTGSELMMALPADAF